MTVLPTRPAPTPFTLDTLVARAAAMRSARTRPASTPQPRPAPRPLADLEARSSLAAKPATTPTALALWITVATCSCGRVHRLPPQYALAKYSENAHSVHYSRADTLAFGDLPRELREKTITIPFCEQCFGGEIVP